MKITEGQSIIVTVSHWETTKRHDENEGNEGFWSYQLSIINLHFYNP
jgi:hypothetical protein